jgi:hypothetical protein
LIEKIFFSTSSKKVFLPSFLKRKMTSAPLASSPTASAAASPSPPRSPPFSTAEKESVTTVFQFVERLVAWLRCGTRRIVQDCNRSMEVEFQKIAEEWKKSGEDPEPTASASRALILEDHIANVERGKFEFQRRFYRIAEVYLIIRDASIVTNSIQHQRLPSLLADKEDELFATSESVVEALRSVGIDYCVWTTKVTELHELSSQWEIDQIYDVYDESWDQIFGCCSHVLVPLGWQNPFDSLTPCADRRRAFRQKRGNAK